MPTDTFFNLPEEKRERIIDCAIDEFATHSYQKSSINQIVEKAVIAKGSFYQYFSNKNDLFKYILDIIAEKKMEYLDYVIKNLEELTFFQTLREAYLAGIKFGKDNPRLESIAARFMKISDEEFKEEILGEAINKSNHFLENLLIKGIEKGEIDSNIDVDLVAFILTQFNLSLTDYFMAHIELEDKEDDLMSFTNDKQIISFIDKLLYVIENGIKKN